MNDIAIISIPYIPYQLPPAAPAVLVGHLRSRGFSAVAREHNMGFKLRCPDEALLARLQVYWSSGDVELDAQDQAPYAKILHDLAQDVVNANSRWWGISVFSQFSRRYARDFIDVLQSYRRPHNRIVVGGLGINQEFLSGLEIDCYIQGEGEVALEKLLRGELNYPGINSPGVQIDDLDQLAGPDYSDYQDLEQYDHFFNSIHVQLTGSRGCIKDCSFCNVAHWWPKFRYRKGDLIAQDIIKIYEQSGIKNFHFTDSLINGNVRELRNMMTVLTEYRQRTGANITWGGQWIARKQKGLPKDYYDLIASSGARAITIGVETGSDRVREHMRKGFTNADLDAELEQFSLRGIQCGFFMFSGYPTETWEDFEDTLRMFQRYSKYVADGTILGSHLGITFMVLEGTPIETQEGVTWARQDGSAVKWRSLVTELDYVEGIKRRIILHQVYNNLGWPNRDSDWELKKLMLELKKIVANGGSDPRPELLQEIQHIVDRYSWPKHPQVATVKMKLLGSETNGWPRIRITINGRVMADQLEVQGSQELELVIDKPRRRNLITWELLNKNHDDTVVDQDGRIIKDKSVLVEELVIDGVRIRADEIYLRSSFRCAQTHSSRRLRGVFGPGRLRFYFKNPTVPYFMSQRQNHWASKKDQNTKVINELTKYYSDLSVHS